MNSRNEALSAVLEQTPYVATYGSLLTGYWNWRWALSDAEVVEKAGTVFGFEMQAHEHFPAIFEADANHSVVVDVFDLTTLDDPEDTLRSIDQMEFGCGYHRVMATTAKGHKVWVYVMPEHFRSRFPYKVEDGDWRRYDNNVEVV